MPFDMIFKLTLIVTVRLWYRSGWIYLMVLVCSSTKVRAFKNWKGGSVKVVYKWFLPLCLACKACPAYWLQLTAHVWQLMSIVFSPLSCISLSLMGQGGACSLWIYHLNLSLEIYNFLWQSVMIMHVLKVLVFIAACDNSCVAIWYIYVNNHFRYVGTGNVIKRACCEHMDVLG